MWIEVNPITSKQGLKNLWMEDLHSDIGLYQPHCAQFGYCSADGVIGGIYGVSALLVRKICTFLERWQLLLILYMKAFVVHSVIRLRFQ